MCPTSSCQPPSSLWPVLSVLEISTSTASSGASFTEESLSQDFRQCQAPGLCSRFLSSLYLLLSVFLLLPCFPIQVPSRESKTNSNQLSDAASPCVPVQSLLVLSPRLFLFSFFKNMTYWMSNLFNNLGPLISLPCNGYYGNKLRTRRRSDKETTCLKQKPVSSEQANPPQLEKI